MNSALTKPIDNRPNNLIFFFLQIITHLDVNLTQDWPDTAMTFFSFFLIKIVFIVLIALFFNILFWK